jgi:crotonobetainyl-CoA:carnitine CoA-transferase CaiB-like acyl-CoA transferase
MGGPGTSFACKDGHIYIFMTTKGHWNALRQLMGDPDWARAFREDWLEFDCTKENVAEFRKHFTDWIALQEKMPITEAAQKAGVAMVPVSTAADLPQHEQLAHRGFFQQAEHPVFGSISYPTVSYKLTASPVRVTSPAPTLGADQAEADS